MKTLRTILPMAAVLLAVAGAWATTAFKTPYLNGTVLVALQNDPDCDEIFECTPENGQMCTNGKDSYAQKTGDPATCALVFEGVWAE